MSDQRQAEVKAAAERRRRWNETIKAGCIDESSYRASMQFMQDRDLLADYAAETLAAPSEPPAGGTVPADVLQAALWITERRVNDPTGDKVAAFVIDLDAKLKAQPAPRPAPVWIPPARPCSKCATLTTAIDIPGGLCERCAESRAEPQAEPLSEDAEDAELMRRYHSEIEDLKCIAELRQQLAEAVAEIATLKRHWIEDDRDLNQLISENERLRASLAWSHAQLKPFVPVANERYQCRFCDVCHSPHVTTAVKHSIDCPVPTIDAALSARPAPAAVVPAEVLAAAKEIIACNSSDPIPKYQARKVARYIVAAAEGATAQPEPAPASPARPSGSSE